MDTDRALKDLRHKDEARFERLRQALHGAPVETWRAVLVGASFVPGDPQPKWEEDASTLALEEPLKSRGPAAKRLRRRVLRLILDAPEGVEVADQCRATASFRLDTDGVLLFDDFERWPDLAALFLTGEAEGVPPAHVRRVSCGRWRLGASSRHMWGSREQLRLGLPEGASGLDGLSVTTLSIQAEQGTSSLDLRRIEAQDVILSSSLEDGHNLLVELPPSTTSVRVHPEVAITLRAGGAEALETLDCHGALAMIGSSFPSLHTVTCDRIASRNLEALASHAPQLRSLRITCGHLESMAGIETLTQLHSVAFGAGFSQSSEPPFTCGDYSGLAARPSLREVAVGPEWFNVAPLLHGFLLRELHVYRGNLEDLSLLWPLHVEEIRLSWCTGFLDLAGAERIEGLRVLNLGGCGIQKRDVPKSLAASRIEVLL